MTVSDGGSTVDYETQYGGATLQIKVVNSIAFDVPFSEDFGAASTVTGEIPANWVISEDVDGNASTDGEDS